VVDEEIAPPAFLALLDQAIRRDMSAPRLDGLIAVAISAEGGWRYWRLKLTRDRAESAFVDALPRRADVTIVLGSREADSLISTGDLPPRPELALVGGDRHLLQRFIERYFAGSSWLEARSQSKRSTEPLRRRGSS
jgi:hypothetical protein